MEEELNPVFLRLQCVDRAFQLRSRYEYSDKSNEHLSAVLEAAEKIYSYITQTKET